jgi:long-subunit acyl-CoA synthetase (AMP-forming)
MTTTGPPTATGATTVGRAFQATAEAFADKPALRSIDGAIDWSWGEYARRVHEAAAGLAGIGLGRGDTMACWLSNRPEFHVADTAAIHLGAASFSVYPTYTVEQAEHIIRDSEARVLVAEESTVESALAVRAGGRTALETIIVVDEGPSATVMSWAEMLACADDSFDLQHGLAAARPTDLVTLIYTSGTTGAPKGVQINNRNVMAQLATMSARLGLPDGISAVSWLPMAHVAERLCTHYFPIAHGWSVTTCDQPRAVASVVAQTRPEFFFSPPRLWEKLRAAVLARSGGEVPTGPAAKAAIEALGFDQLRVAIVGAAPCPQEVIEFWHLIGVPLGEVYGLSETTGVATVNPPDAIRIGTVGTPLQGVEIALSPVNEILIRGPVVMSGYRNLPDRTAEAIDGEGWFHSGDVGTFDDDGYVRIVDRIKELIINAAGKNMSPANIEATVKTSGELIGQVCCIGDGRPYNTALITLDPDASAAFAAEQELSASGPPALAGCDEVRTEVAAAVARANERLARVEQIKKFTILPVDWTPDSDELTPTMKLKRKPIAEKYAAEIERMYSS